MLGMGSLLFVALVAGAGGAAALIARACGCAPYDVQRIGWSSALALGAVLIAISIVKRIARRGLRIHRPEHGVWILELDLRDARALRITNDDKLAGYLFLLDANDSLFLASQCEWFDDDESDERYVAPARVRFVIAVAEGHVPRLLRREDSGPLRHIPDADPATVAAVEAGCLEHDSLDEIVLLTTPRSACGGASGDRPDA